MTSRLDAIALPLFVPADRPDRYVKAFAAGADAVILDLEDAVAPDAKDRARTALAAAASAIAEAASPVLVRVNAIGSRWHEADLAAVAALRLAGVILPKAESSRDISETERRAGVPIVALIESARGLAAAREIAGRSLAARLRIHRFRRRPRLCPYPRGSASRAVRTGTGEPPRRAFRADRRCNGRIWRCRSRRGGCPLCRAARLRRQAVDPPRADRAGARRFRALGTGSSLGGAGACGEPGRGRRLGRRRHGGRSGAAQGREHHAPRGRAGRKDPMSDEGFRGTIREEDIVGSIADALQYIAVYHPPSFVKALAEAYGREESPAAKNAHRADSDKFAPLRLRTEADLPGHRHRQRLRQDRHGGRGSRPRGACRNSSTRVCAAPTRIPIIPCAPRS